jgi:molybdate transport system substrate-binding protein
MTLSGCAGTPSSGADDTGAAGGPGAAGAPSGTVTVLAAASLTESFEALAREVELSNPGIDVEVSYGSSATLVQQVLAGAPADVVALAGESAAEPIPADRARDRQVFATNVLEIAVPPANPGRITDIDDLGRPGLKVVLCAETVPCGKAADATFRKARVVPSVVSRELDVKATMAKVRLGEADAAVVYRSDVVAAKGAVTGVEIRAPFNTSLRYPIIRLADSAAAIAFVERVMSAEGQRTIRSFGFGAP